jgi:hypothetical protein
MLVNTICTVQGRKNLRYLLSSLAFHANICARIRAIADLHDRKTGFESRITFLYLYNLILDLLSD